MHGNPSKVRLWWAYRGPVHVSDARVVTPEAVALRFETAGVGSRFIARSLDTLIQFAVLVAVLFAGGAAGSGGFGNTGVTIVALFAVFVVLFVYSVVLETVWHGR